jgi:hypothetical protein
MADPRPNTFVIGAPKCGTTALTHYLASRPDVFLCTPKEPHFWSSDLSKGRHEMVPGDLDAYLALFAQADPEQHRVIIDGSTSYLRSRIAVPRILDFHPESRFVAMLRNPVEVVVAYHMEQYYVRAETIEDFTTAWEIQDRRAQGLDLPAGVGSDQLLYRDIADFAEQIRRFIALVPEHRRRIVLLDHLKSDPGAVYRDTLSFLGLADDGRTEFPHVNAAHAPRYPRLSRLVLHPPRMLVAPVHKARQYVLTHHVPGVASLKQASRTEKPRALVAPEVLQQLYAHFAPAVSELEDLLGTDLSEWRQP